MIYRALPSYPLSEWEDCSPESLNASSALSSSLIPSLQLLPRTTAFWSTLFRNLRYLGVGCLAFNVFFLWRDRLILQDFSRTRYIGKMNFYESDSINFRKILLRIFGSVSLVKRSRLVWFYDSKHRSRAQLWNNIQETSVTRFPVSLVGKFLSRTVLPPLDLFRKLSGRLLNAIDQYRVR